MAERLVVDPGQPDPTVIERAAVVIRAGGIVAYPTDTYYGLAVDPYQPVAVARLRAAKSRPFDSAFPLIAADLEQLDLVGVEWTEQARALAASFWPGPLTLVLRAGAGLADGVTGPGPTVAVRVPACPVACELARAARGVITSTSANLAGQSPSVAADQVLAALGTRIGLLLDAGTAPGGAPSTIVDATVETPRLLREGLIEWARVLESLEG